MSPIEIDEQHTMLVAPCFGKTPVDAQVSKMISRKFRLAPLSGSCLDLAGPPMSTRTK